MSTQPVCDWCETQIADYVAELDNSKEMLLCRIDAIKLDEVIVKLDEPAY
jgi:hypothetical protein